MSSDLTVIYDRLYAWCESRGFAGPDPFDGLNSRVFRATPFANYRSPRLVLTQLVKRSPIDLRPLLRVAAGVNPKGVALFALAELSRFRETGARVHEDNARRLLKVLRGSAIESGSQLAFGYNFDWQSRNFFAPCGTPTVVPTAFASQAFFEASALLGDVEYSDVVLGVANFVAKRLVRSFEADDELCFSYTPLDRSRIYNASLLAAECLSRSNYDDHQLLARKAVNFVVRRQREDGAWSYGDTSHQAWVDSFHTAYVLLSLKRIGAPGEGSAEAFDRGLRYWIEHFVLKRSEEHTSELQSH